MWVRGRDSAVLLKILIFTLTLNEIYGHSRQWYAQLPRRHFNRPIFDKESSMNSDSDYDSSGSSHSTSEVFSNRRNARKPMQFPSASTGKKDAEPENKFVFPDYSVESRKSEIDSPPTCKDTTYCEHVSDYPTELVDRIINNNRNFQNYKNIDMADNIVQRIDLSATEPLCVSTEQVVYPRTAETMNKEWMFVVNTSNYTQGVRIEKCVDEGNSCKLIDNFAEGYVTSCKQKFIYRQLMALQPDGSMIHEYFRFPTSCCCHVELIGLPEMRLLSLPISKSPRMT